MKKILFLLLTCSLLNAQWSVSTAERNALIAIYNHLDGNNWSQKWDLEKDPYNWYGVKISNGKVSELTLNSNLLSGTFPTSVGSLTNLKKLDLSSNKLHGNVPNLTSLSNLVHINLNNNELTGDILNSISGLHNLEEIYIGNNSFSVDNVDFSGFSNLKSLDVSKLNLIEIPNSLTALQNLTLLNVSNNNITNFTNFSLLVNLQELNLSGNNLTKIPSEINSKASLKSFDLSNNSITDFSSLGSFTNLEWLSIENNSLQSIPSQISSLSNLIHLNLGKNKITGGTSILSSLNKLEQLWLNHNKFTGNIPTDVLALPNLLSLSFQSNDLEGTIPNNLPEICNLSNNRFSKTEIENFLLNHQTNTDFVYSPQRYDQAKTVKAPINSNANLDQILSSADGYSFTWYKTLDKNTSNFTEKYTINSVTETDFDTYTCEALFIKNDTLYNIYYSNYREPITLEKDNTLSTENPVDKVLVIYPNPTNDFLYIKNNNYKVENINLYDIGGRLIKEFSSQAIQLDFRNLPTSSYILNIKTSEGYQNFKIIKK